MPRNHAIRTEMDTVDPHEQAEKFDLPRWKVVSLLLRVEHGDIQVIEGQEAEIRPLAFDPTAEGVAV